MTSYNKDWSKNSQFENFSGYTFPEHFENPQTFDDFSKQSEGKTAEDSDYFGENGHYICCFTGHRSVEDNFMIRLPETLHKVIENQYQKGARIFRCGGAIGFDTIAALKVIHLRQKYPDIKLELCLPCKDQTAKWGRYDTGTYKFIFNNCDSFRYAAEEYTRTCMFERNRMLVDGSKICIALYRGGRGGTGYTFAYALKNGLEVINVYEIIKKELSEKYENRF